MPKWYLLGIQVETIVMYFESTWFKCKLVIVLSEGNGEVLVIYLFFGSLISFFTFYELFGEFSNLVEVFLDFEL